MQVRAAIAEPGGGPLVLRDLELDDPGENEVLVRVMAAGICHTDISMRDGAIPCPLPAVLGHEGAGIVERVGAKVRALAPGDHVILTVASCGACARCAKGEPYYCTNIYTLNLSGKRADGSAAFKGEHAHVHGAMFQQSSFASYALATERNAIKVAKDVPFHILAPLGCGVQTGAGAVLNTMRPEAGSDIAVFGAGGVGMSAIMAARIAGCANIVAVDQAAARLDLARELGATATINVGEANPSEKLREMFPGGIQYAVEASGNPRALSAALDSLRMAGMCVVVGTPGRGVKIEVEVMRLVHANVRGSVMGESVPQIFLPRLIELYRQGRFPVDRMIRTYPLADINKAIAHSEAGVTVKPVIVFDGAPGAAR